MKTKLLIGDSVRIKPHKIGRCKECLKGDSVGMTEYMSRFTGKIGKIEKESKLYKGGFIIKNNSLIFSPCMLEKVEKKCDCQCDKPLPDKVIKVDKYGKCICCGEQAGFPENYSTPPQPKECIHDYKDRDLAFKVWDNEKNQWYEPTYAAYAGKLEYLMIGLDGSLSMVTLDGISHESTFPKRFTIYQVKCLKIEYR